MQLLFLSLQCPILLHVSAVYVNHEICFLAKIISLHIKLLIMC
jgi:hypothetical protein